MGVLLCLLYELPAYAQLVKRYNSFSYNVNEGLLQSNVLDMAFDQNNFCWLSFANGIQKFNGKIFTTVPVQAGLPDDKWVHFFQCKNGDLLIAHSKGISKYDIGKNNFEQVYDNPSPMGYPMIFIAEDDNKIYCYTEMADIIGIDCTTYKVVDQTSTGLPAYSANNVYYPLITGNKIQHRVAFNVNSTLYLWDLRKKKLLFRSAALSNMARFSTSLKSASEVLFYKDEESLSLVNYNFVTGRFNTIFKKEKNSAQAFRSVFYTWQDIPLISYYNKLYETDTNFKVFKSELVNFQNMPISGTNSIARIKEDNFGNLYLVSINEGFKKIKRNNYPIQYFGSEKKENNYTLSILPDKKNNRLLAGTYGSGLLIFDTLQHLTKHIEKLPGQHRSFSVNTIVKNNKGEYILFVCGDRSVWVLSNDLSKLIPIRITTSLPDSKSGIGYFGNFLFQNTEEAVVHSGGRLFRVNFKSQSVTEQEISPTSPMGAMLYNTSILTHTNDELVFFDATTFNETKRIPFKNTGAVRCFAKDAAGNIFIGSNKGVFKIDSTGKILMSLNKEKGLPDECIYAIVIDDDGYLWCSTNKGIFKANSENSILQLKKEDGLQENEFNTNVAVKTGEGEIFFGGVNGISSFHPADINSFEEKINLLFTKIKINNEEAFKNTAAWNIQKIDLPYHQNSLSFDFIAMANTSPGQYIYQYKMDGIDDQWIQNNDLQTVRYFLPPGKYVFKIYASRLFNKDAAAMKEIRIVIHPPYWKTWWFVVLIAVILIAGTTYSINRYNKIKYRKKMMELQAEHKLQTERERISRDLHDSLGAYANAVLYNTELLQKKLGPSESYELMNDLKFASKDIITSLRETIWALKKDNYTAEDCLLRLRNFIQPFSRYYPHIHFSVEGKAPAGMQLNHTHALNIVRIVQEAVSNSIKHAEAKNIILQSGDEKGRWKLTISDDGKGFDYGAAKDIEAGNGLHNMQKRSDDSGFYFSIISTDGTTVTIAV